MASTSRSMASTSRTSNDDDEEVQERWYPVYLNVYDATSLNPYLRFHGLGFYHTCVQVHGMEHMFRPTEGDETQSGIIFGDQRQLQYCEGLKLYDSILIGYTSLDQDQVLDLVLQFKARYPGVSYRHFTNNCHHFCDLFCQALTGNPIPRWVNRIALVGSLWRCMEVMGMVMTMLMVMVIMTVMVMVVMLLLILGGAVVMDLLKN